MKTVDNIYKSLVLKVLNTYKVRRNRTATPALSIFGEQLDISLEKFPLLTTKKVHFKSVAYELLWFLKGDTNIKWLNDHGVTIWDEWADENGDLGPIYGRQWVSWPCNNKTVNQIARVIDTLQRDPYSRRHVVSAWNVCEIDAMALAPCHVLFQFYVDDDDRLSCQVYQRSADVFLGLPFNIASYALLTYMIAHVCGYTPDRLIMSLGDVHLYTNHISQALVQLDREPREQPTLLIKGTHDSVFDIQYDDLQLVGYNPHPALPAPVSV